MKSPLSVSSVTVLVTPLCALAGIVVEPSFVDVRTGPARDVPKREGRNSLRPEQEGILPVNTERAETRRHGGG